MTLMDVMVGMVVMTIFGSILTSSMVSMFSASNKVQAVNNSSMQLNTAFDRLDKQVRYASFINTPNTAGDSVAFATLNAGVTTCTQLQVRAPSVGQPLSLMERSFVSNATPPTTWSQLAAGVTVGAVPPFQVLPPTNGRIVQQLQLNLSASDGVGKANSVSASAITFSALNYSPFTAAASCSNA